MTSARTTISLLAICVAAVAVVALAGCSRHPEINLGIEIRDTRGRWHAYLPPPFLLDTSTPPYLSENRTYNPQYPTLEALVYDVRSPGTTDAHGFIDGLVYRLPAGQHLPEFVDPLVEHFNSIPSVPDRFRLSKQTIRGFDVWSIRDMPSMFESSMILFVEKNGYVLEFTLPYEGNFDEAADAIFGIVESFQELRP